MSIYGLGLRSVPPAQSLFVGAALSVTVCRVARAHKTRRSDLTIFKRSGSSGFDPGCGLRQKANGAAAGSIRTARLRSRRGPARPPRSRRRHLNQNPSWRYRWRWHASSGRCNLALAGGRVKANAKSATSRWPVDASTANATSRWPVDSSESSSTSAPKATPRAPADSATSKSASRWPVENSTPRWPVENSTPRWPSEPVHVALAYGIHSGGQPPVVSQTRARGSERSDARASDSSADA